MEKRTFTNAMFWACSGIILVAPHCLAQQQEQQESVLQPSKIGTQLANPEDNVVEVHGDKIITNNTERTAGGKTQLKGQVVTTLVPDEPILIRLGGHKHSSDSVYGKTLFINQGFGGAVLY
jgi:hypothetical protein